MLKRTFLLVWAAFTIGWIAPASAQPGKGGQTFVAAGSDLAPVLNGRVPESIDQLQKMERQQTRVSAVASSCTVSVQIGNSQGCGVIITGDGYVLTAAHVAMRSGLEAILTMSDGRRLLGKTLGLNREVDAGLIKILDDSNGGKPWPHASLGSSQKLEKGVWCIAMGHPGGYERGRNVVARVGRILAVRSGAVVTDCALIGGDSGGPLFDLEGKLIGVHSRIGNDVADNLHVPVDHYHQTWDRLVRGESWGFLPGFRPSIGVKGDAKSSSALIVGVVADSPAEQAGIVDGDIILSFNDIRLTNFDSLKAAVSETMPGEHVSIRLRRGDAIYRVEIEIGRATDS